MADICILMNPGSGAEDRQREARVAAIEKVSAEHPGRIELRVLEKGGSISGAARRAVADGFGTVVAAGGDGTINAVAAEVAGSGRRLGILPFGTFNYVARRLGLPEDPEAAVRVLLEGREDALDIGEVNGRVFLNNASLGAYPAILRRRERVYGRWGRSRLAAHVSTLAELSSFRTSMRLRVTIDGEVKRRRTPLVFVAVNSFQLEQFGLDGGGCIEDGRFALFLLPDCGRLELLRMAAALAMGALKPERDFELLCGADILVETTRRRRSVARDGENERMDAPFRFRFRQDALTVLVPVGGTEPKASA